MVVGKSCCNNGGEAIVDRFHSPCVLHANVIEEATRSRKTSSNNVSFELMLDSFEVTALKGVGLSWHADTMCKHRYESFACMVV
jgi:hypothetical protein